MINEHSIAPPSANQPGPHTIDVVIILLPGVLLLLPFLPTTSNDAYYYISLRSKLISGLGYVYNAGEHVLGTTTPLYTLCLTFIGRLGLDFILVGKLTNIVADTAAVLSQQALRPLRIYLAWMVLYIATFTFIQSGRFGWYYAPIMPVLFTLVVLGGAVWFEQTRRFSAMTRILQSNLRYVLAGTLFLALVVASGISVYAS